MEPHPSGMFVSRQVGASLRVQQSFWKQRWLAPQLVVTGVQTPLTHSVRVSCVPVQV
jgi:hypothetical protein